MGYNVENKKTRCSGLRRSGQHQDSGRPHRGEEDQFGGMPQEVRMMGPSAGRYVKGQIFEGGFHLPLAIRWGGAVKPGRRSKTREPERTNDSAEHTF